jgi:hypothetical protein
MYLPLLFGRGGGGGGGGVRLGFIGFQFHRILCKGDGIIKPFHIIIPIKTRSNALQTESFYEK